MDGEEKTLTASVYTFKCFECADDVENMDFPLTEEGFEKSKNGFSKNSTNLSPKIQIDINNLTRSVS